MSVFSIVRINYFCPAFKALQDLKYREVKVWGFLKYLMFLLLSTNGHIKRQQPQKNSYKRVLSVQLQSDVAIASLALNSTDTFGWHMFTVITMSIHYVVHSCSSVKWYITSLCMLHDVCPAESCAPDVTKCSHGFMKKLHWLYWRNVSVNTMVSFMYFWWRPVASRKWLHR